MKITYVYHTKRLLDFVILGATGFTGRHIVEEVSRTLLANNYDLKWGIAGRDTSKLCQIIKQISIQNNTDLSNIPIIEMDINDNKSLLKMCRMSQMVINSCGPFALFGEKVINACIDCGSHHIDISGEPYFLETIQYKYNELAKQQNVCIIGSCGFDSIPSDIGVQYLKNNFNGTLNSVETYLTINTGEKGSVGNFATWDSLINGFAHRKQLSQLRRQLYSNLFKTYQWKHQIKRKSIFRNNNYYCVPFPGSDRSVVIRTQLYNYTNFNERPTQIETYFNVKNLNTLFGLILVNLTVNMLATYEKGRKLLIQNPYIFSNGVFTKQMQTSREILLKNSFEILMIGKGWHHKYIDPNFQPTQKPNKTVIAKISGGDLAYLDTSKIVIQSTINCLQQLKQNKLPFGVFTPSVALDNHSIIDKLNKNNIHFEIIKQ